MRIGGALVVLNDGDNGEAGGAGNAFPHLAKGIRDLSSIAYEAGDVGGRRGEHRALPLSRRSHPGFPAMIHSPAGNGP